MAKPTPITAAAVNQTRVPQQTEVDPELLSKLLRKISDLEQSLNSLHEKLDNLSAPKAPAAKSKVRKPDTQGAD